MADRTIVLAQNKRHAVRGLTVVNPQEFSAYQEEDDNLTYIIDMSSYLDGATISSVTRTATGVTVSNASNTTTRLTQRLKGFGYVDFKVTTSSGDIEEFRVTIEPRANSSFFLPSTLGSQPQNTAQFFETVAQAAATNPGSSVNYIWVSGYSSAADGRGGLYKRTTSASNLDTFTTANGVVFERSFYKTTITAQPADDGSAHATIDTSFSGDLSGVRFPVYHRVTGTDTLGQPATGYESIPETMPFYVWLENESGWNESTSTNSGRTGLAAHRIRIQNDGQGDVYGLWVTGGVGSTRSGSTSFLANPAAVIVGGNLGASVDGAYLNPGEFLLEDNGNDVAGIGWVVNLDRTDATGAKNAWWAGFRAQSTGSAAVDSAFSATGSFRFGLDLSFCTFDANKAAISLKADDRIYGNVTATDSSGLSRYPSSVSNSYQTYSSSLGAWHFVINNTSALQIYGTSVISPLAIRSDLEFRVSTNKVVGARDTGWTAMTGTTDKATSYDTSTVTLAQLAGRVMAIQAALTTHGLLGA